jgi:hypothetical protein
MRSKIPGLMRRYVRRKGSFNVGGLLMRAIFVQSVTP